MVWTWMQASNRPQEKLRNLLDLRDTPARNALLDRGGNAFAFNHGRGDYWDLSLKEIAELSGKGDEDAKTILKLVKQAKKKAQKYD